MFRISDVTSVQVLTRKPHPKAVVFDWDDTIFTGMRVWVRLQGEIIAGIWSGGQEPTREVLHAAETFARDTAGRTDLERFRLALKETESYGCMPPHDAVHYVGGYKAKIEDYVDKAVERWVKDPHEYYLPGVVGLIKALRDAGLPLYVATANHILVKYDMIARMGLSDHFEGVFGVGSVGFDEYDKCQAIKRVKKLNAGKHGDVLMIGDGVGDVKAAKDAEAFSIGVSDDVQVRDRLAKAGADIVISDFGSLEPILEALNVM
jgi:phosphoglycolate phosphatase-like HAD superfamily hydrolase